MMRRVHQESLAAAMHWIETAHEATGRHGVSAGYDLREGWQPTYPEISGYLIPTMLRAAAVLARPALVACATEIGEWLLGLQRCDGSFPGGTGTEGDPVVFDVGQILLGLLALARTTGEPAMLRAAVRAGDWLMAAQQPDGAWLSHFGYPNTYSSRITWALGELHAQTGDPALRDSMGRSLAWLVTQARPDGWLDRMAFSAEHTPWTHTIGYALRGLLRAAALTGGELGARAASAADACAMRLAALPSELYPLLPGEIGPGFAPRSDYACLTGDAQMVTVWLDVAARIEDPVRRERLRDRCAEVVRRLLDAQVRQNLQPEAVGALPGSWPLTGGFEPLAFPSWATKFLADAVLDLAEAGGHDDDEPASLSSASVAASALAG